MEDRIDIISPAFFAGFVGYAVSGSGVGFVIGAGLVWFSMTALLVLAVAVANREPKSDSAGSIRPGIEMAV